VNDIDDNPYVDSEQPSSSYPTPEVFETQVKVPQLPE
jgi:hypothetical protein